MIRPRACIFLLLTLLTLTAFAPADLAAKTSRKNPAKEFKTSQLQPAQVLDLKHWSNPDYTRIAITLDRDVTWESHELDKAAGRSGKPGRIFIDLQNTRLGNGLRDITIGDGLLKGVRAALYKPGVVRVVLDTDNIRDYKIFPLSDPARLIIDVRGDRRTEISRLESSLASHSLDGIAAAPPARTAAEEPKAERAPRSTKKHPAISKIRRIVVDPGHGGHDPGAVGQTGLQEKDVVLSIGLKLREKLREELGLDVVMTRSTDIFIPLEERTAIANKVNADLFVSIHANAAPNRNAAGIETYYLNLAKTEKVAQLAAKENGTSLEKVSTLQAILFDLMANYKLNDSAHLAEEVQKSLYKTNKSKYPDTKNLGVKQGPFYVLVGASMPSILTEVAFISNSTEESHLKDSSFHDLAADGILDGIRGYISSLK
ncbi:N-acetylmuramoyl-L-alanine amidase [Trichlorobacter lovleyi]|nr:N-acetylmuramoyl-L-alanine amidase [Trichlorobacter lovleyi]